MAAEAADIVDSIKRKPVRVSLKISNTLLLTQLTYSDHDQYE